MPTPLFQTSDNKNSRSGFVQRTFTPRTFHAPSDACNRQRGLFQNTATPVGAGLVLNGANQGAFKKQAFPACQ